MKILAIERETGGTTDTQFTQPLLQREAGRAWELYQSGIIREMYFHRDQHIAVLMLECADVDEARAALDTLPLVQAGFDFDLMPLIAYSGFARLFAGSTNDKP